jgi:hypothetical protein
LRSRWRFGRLGCLGSLVVVVMIAVAVVVGLNPWAVHIGGRLTLLGNWSGIARAHVPGGADLGVQLNLGVDRQPGCGRTTGECDNLDGTAVICSKAGRFTFSNLGGFVDGYWSTDGHAMRLNFSHGSTTLTRYLTIRFTGTWHGPAYDASDGGYLDRGFDANGNPRAQVGSPDATRAVPLSFQPGDFSALCASVGASG